MGIAVLQFVPSYSVELKIYARYMPFTSFIHYFRFWAAILVIWWVLDLFWFHHLVALPYVGKVTKACPVTPNGYKMAAKRVVWG
jgi:hypothetical protein